jgi:hypothetical protein
MIFELGHAIEIEVVKWLELAGYTIEGRQLAFSACADMLRGHCDGIIHGVTSRPHLLEIKSASKSSFDKFVAHGVASEPKYAAQLQLYMGLGNLERALFVVYCKDNSDIYAERVHFNRPEFERLLLKAESIITANEMPEPVEDYFSCRFCDFSPICKGGDVFMSEQFCSVCKYHRWHGFREACHFPEHPFFLPARSECADHTKLTCKDFINHLDKRLPHDPDFIPAVEEVREFVDESANA